MPAEEKGLEPHLAPLEAERALLHAAFIDEEVVDANMGLPGEAFYAEVHARVWEAMKGCRTTGRLLDMADFVSRGILSVDELMAIQAVDSSPLAAPYYVEAIRQAWVRRTLLARLARVQGELAQGKDLGTALAELRDLEAAMDLVRAPEPVSIYEAADAMVTYLERLAEGREVRPVGVSLGAEELMTLAPGELHLLAAGTGVGKSAIALQIASAVEAAGWPVLIYSLEMRAEEWAARYVVQTTGLPLRALRMGDLDERAWSVLVDGVAKIAGRQIYVQDRLYTYEQILGDVRRQARRLGVRLFVVDYMGLVQRARPAKEERRHAVLEEMANGLKVLARELNVAVLAVHQLNRLGERETGLHTWGDSYGMVRPADGAYILVRKRGEDGTRLGEYGEWRREKVRHGHPGVVPLLFRPERLAFAEMGYEEEIWGG